MTDFKASAGPIKMATILLTLLLATMRSFACVWVNLFSNQLARKGLIVSQSAKIYTELEFIDCT